MHAQRVKKQTKAATPTKQSKPLHKSSTNAPKRKLAVRARKQQRAKLSTTTTTTTTSTTNQYSHLTQIPQPHFLPSSRIIQPLGRKAPAISRRWFSQGATTTANASEIIKNKTLLQRFGLTGAADITLSPEEHKNFNRNKMIPAALLTHLSLGSVFAWSLFNGPLMLSNGVVEQAASDWTLGQVMPVFSTTMATFGTMSFLSGRMGLNEKFGPRITSLMGAGLFAGGFGISALAASTHTLPLIYLGYGLMAGAAVGVSYVGPVATLMKWFPDRRGLASSLGIVGFGAAGIFAAQFIEKFLGIFRKLPKRVGDATQYPTEIVNGKLMATIDGIQQEVVIATAASLKKLGKVGETLQEGMYLVGSGDTGISNTFLALGLIYTVAIGCASFLFRLPNERYDPLLPDKVKPLTQNKNIEAAKKIMDDAAAKVKAQMNGTTTTTSEGAADSKDGKTKVGTDGKLTTTDGKDTSSSSTSTTAVVEKPKFDYIATHGDLKPGNVLKTKQFWLLWSGLLFNSAAAYAIIGSAKNLMLDVYGVQYPLLVTSAFAATFVSMISAFNLSGRLGWGAVSDKIGRKKTFNIMWGLSIPFYLGIPFSTSLLEQGVDMQSSMLPMAVFYASVCGAIACFGGSAAISPAYLVDLYGPKFSAANAGQLLSYLMISGYLGPLTVTTLREMATKQAIEDLTSKVDIGTFVAKFGSTPDRLGELMASKSISIEKLMEIVPDGTPDPSPYLYNTVFITLASLQFIAVMANVGINKVPNQKFIDQQAQDESAQVPSTEATKVGIKVNQNAIENSPEMKQIIDNQSIPLAERDAAVLKKIQKDSITEAPKLMTDTQVAALQDAIKDAGDKITADKTPPAPVVEDKKQ